MLLLAQCWTAAATAEALERAPHAIGRWPSAFGDGGPAALFSNRPARGNSATPIWLSARPESVVAVTKAANSGASVS